MSTRYIVKLYLTPYMAQALQAIVAEGAEGLLTDKSAAAGYIGGTQPLQAGQAARDELIRALQPLLKRYRTEPLK